MCGYGTGCVKVMTVVVVLTDDQASCPSMSPWQCTVVSDIVQSKSFQIIRRRIIYEVNQTKYYKQKNENYMYIINNNEC